MANFTNFQSDIDRLSRGYSRFMVSRVVPTTRNALIEVQVPATLPEAYSVEISLYSVSTNALLFNETIHSSTSDSPFYTQTLQYNGTNQLRRFLFIDFSKIVVSPLDRIPDGDLQAVLNFFAEEIGSYESQSLYITQISPSRREVELKLAPEYDTPINRTKLLEMSRPQINSDAVLDAVDQIFGKPTTTQIQSNNTVFSFAFVTASAQFPKGFTQEVLTSIENSTNRILTQSYGAVTASIKSEIASGKHRFTDTYLQTLISEQIELAVAAVTEDSTNSRFELV